MASFNAAVQKSLVSVFDRRQANTLGLPSPGWRTGTEIRAARGWWSAGLPLRIRPGDRIPLAAPARFN